MSDGAVPQIYPFGREFRWEEVYLSVAVEFVEHIIDVLRAHLAHSWPEEGLEIRDDTLRRSGGPPPRWGRLARDVHYGQRRGENRRSTRSRQNGIKARHHTRDRERGHQRGEPRHV
jgi:hypothetical protein